MLDRLAKFIGCIRCLINWHTIRDGEMVRSAADEIIVERECVWCGVESGPRTATQREAKTFETMIEPRARLMAAHASVAQKHQVDEICDAAMESVGLPVQSHGILCDHTRPVEEGVRDGTIRLIQEMPPELAEGVADGDPISMALAEAMRGRPAFRVEPPNLPPWPVRKPTVPAKKAAPSRAVYDDTWRELRRKPSKDVARETMEAAAAIGAKREGKLTPEGKLEAQGRNLKTGAVIGNGPLYPVGSE